MRIIIFSAILVVLTLSLSAQLKFDLGIKGGANFSEISFDVDDYTSESIVKTHFGAFGRIGWDRVFIQPELYFSGKGGSIDRNLGDALTHFNFKTFDVPLLLGLRVIKGEKIDFQIVAGPVFSNITSKEISADEIFDPAFFNNHYFGFQYGIGVDILFLTLQARMENGLTEFYSNPDPERSSGKNNTFMVSLGIRFL